MTNLLDRYLDEPDLPEPGPVDSARPPTLPVVMLGLTTLTAVALLVAAVADGAGSTDQVPVPAVLAWVVGSLIGLLLYAWFGLLDSVQRSTGRYEEPPWQPRRVATALVVVSWLAGSSAAFLVAQTVARR